MAVERAPAQVSLFGVVEKPRTYATPNRVSPKPAGYAQAPGTGPQDETCGSCAYCCAAGTRVRNYYKCGLLRAAWTHSRESDVLLKSPACSNWQSGQPHPNTVHGAHDRALED